jgi:hypothetical protein
MVKKSLLAPLTQYRLCAQALLPSLPLPMPCRSASRNTAELKQ